MNTIRSHNSAIKYNRAPIQEYNNYKDIIQMQRICGNSLVTQTPDNVDIITTDTPEFYHTSPVSEDNWSQPAPWIGMGGGFSFPSSPDSGKDKIKANSHVDDDPETEDVINVESNFNYVYGGPMGVFTSNDRIDTEFVEKQETGDNNVLREVIVKQQSRHGEIFSYIKVDKNTGEVLEDEYFIAKMK